jgi:hypothetical protein
LTLVDDAERLATLAGEANAAADAGSAEAALHEVLNQLLAVAPSIDYGIVERSWWEQVPETERANVRAASARARSAVGPLRTETDHVLAAYGRGDSTMDRGALAALLRAFRAYRTALEQAQAEVLRAWSERLWPADELDKLEIHAVVPDTTRAATEILTLLQELTDVTDAVDGDGLLRLFERCQAAEAQGMMLRQRPVPEAVLEFFKQVRERGTLSLSDLTLDVFAWLDEHDATRLFVVGRPE